MNPYIKFHNKVCNRIIHNKFKEIMTIKNNHSTALIRQVLQIYLKSFLNLIYF